MLICPYTRMHICLDAHMPIRPLAQMPICPYAHMPICPYAHMPRCLYIGHRAYRQMRECPNPGLIPSLGILNSSSHGRPGRRMAAQTKIHYFNVLETEAIAHGLHTRGTNNFLVKLSTFDFQRPKATILHFESKSNIIE